MSYLPTLNTDINQQICSCVGSLIAGISINQYNIANENQTLTYKDEIKHEQ